MASCALTFGSLIVAVTGEPGIGLRPTANDRPWSRGRYSDSLAGAEAYLPVLEALDSLFHWTVGPGSTA